MIGFDDVRDYGIAGHIPQFAVSFGFLRQAVFAITGLAGSAYDSGDDGSKEVTTVH